VNALNRALSQRFAHWSARREGPPPFEVVLDRRRVYILPTRAGLAFAAMLATLLLGSANFALQLGYLLTFFVAGIALVAMFHTHRNLAGLKLQPHRASHVFAGDLASFELSAANPDGTPRQALGFSFLDPASAASTLVAADVAGESARIVTLALPATRRGRLACPRVRIETRFPLGLWRAWAYYTPPLTTIVYPAPEPLAPPLPPATEGGAEHSGPTARGDDFAGVRPYQTGDTQRLIAWRLVARVDELTVKLFDGSAGGELLLDFDALPSLPLEARLARLTSWVLQADARQARYGLRLPSGTITASVGAEHRERCLTALALA
jgi:uncharacterized protein (DUF58 family)